MTGRVGPTCTRFSAASVGVAYAINWNSDPKSTQHFAPLYTDGESFMLVVRKAWSMYLTSFGL